MSDESNWLPNGPVLIAPPRGSKEYLSGTIRQCFGIWPSHSMPESFMGAWESRPLVTAWLMRADRFSWSNSICRRFLSINASVRAIAAFLDRETARTDALIERKRRQIELLQEKRSALISHAVTKGLDSHAPMKDSGIEWLGQIPKHWRIVPLKYSLLPRGGAIKTGPFGSQLLSSDMASGDVKVYNQRNVLDRDFLSGENYVSDDKYEELKSFTVFPQDVLITTRGTIGRCALLPDNAERGILHPCLMRVQPNPLITSPEYVALLIQDSGIVLLQLQLLSNATTIEVIYSESLKSVRLPLPPASEQQAILTYVTREAERHDALISKVQDSIDVLREHRTTLISAAVTGKIDVRGEVA